MQEKIVGEHKHALLRILTPFAEEGPEALTPEDTRGKSILVQIAKKPSGLLSLWPGKAGLKY